MDTRYLKSLITVVECGSIAHAARIEGLTAAAISQRILALERQLGFELLSRVGHAAKPSQACLGLLPRARRIVREVALLAGDADGAGLTGQLRIGAISTVLTGLMPEALRALTVSAPGLTPVIVPGTSRSLYQALLSGEVDAAILVAPPFELPKALQAVSLRKEPLVFLSKEKSSISIPAQLMSQPYIRYDPDAWGGRYAEQYLADQGLKPTPMVDLDALETIAMLVTGGMGVSLVPYWSGFEQWGHQCAVSQIGNDRYDREIALISPAQTDRPNMISALCAALSTTTPHRSESFFDSP
ncbi:LysR substrate-binding domain-containing protein [Pseudomonas rustica]|jgi:DNA-binding transcriptional LysR family regulator|uniref:LysR family transcriptional regulator n=1 Tax=Pseudomonas rustica TaxID=2827099 RepID=A0ABS5MYG3_9PSED|nr:LysR substrate-binding domain-containing protein [Pseudomonas rustica]MBS4079342.1 LysR family transcriptional regulator [Pseudomonas rustica]